MNFKMCSKFKLERVLQSLFIALITALSANVAEAHVKWFVEFDVSKPPAPIGDVLTGDFVKMFLVSVAAVYIFFLVDRYITKKVIWRSSTGS